MAEWLQILIAVAAFVVLAPLLAWLGKRYSRNVKGSWVLAGFLLGVGQPGDPPPKHRVEAAQPGKDDLGAGEPPADD